MQAVRTGSCLGTNGGGTAFPTCAETLIKDRGAVLFKGPLNPEETAQYAKIATDNASSGAETARALAFQAMLLAPQFVFRAEVGEPVAGMTGTSRLTSYEVASAVAYSLTDAPPDADLWDAATRNALGTPEQIAAHVNRILAGKQATAVRDFPAQYFQIRRALEVTKAMEKPCTFGKERIVTDAKMLIDDLVTSNGRSWFLKALLTSTDTYYGCDS